MTATSRRLDDDDAAQEDPRPSSLETDEATTGAPSAPPDRYLRRPGWASRWVRGQVLARHRDGAEVGVVGSAALTWMALDPPSSTGRSATPPSSTKAPLASAPPNLTEATAVELAARIEQGWPDVGPVTVASVEEALAILVASALVERVPSTVEG